MSTLGPLAREFLRAAGFSERVIETIGPKTRIMHDLHFVGDDLIDMIDVLRQKFNVDLAEFDPSSYTPREFTPRLYLFTFLPNISVSKIKMKEYNEITMEMIETAIQTKQWPKQVPTAPALRAQ